VTGTTLVHAHCHISEQLCGISVMAVDGVVTSIRPDKAIFTPGAISARRPSTPATSPPAEPG
jgi:hypothetical protein